MTAKNGGMKNAIYWIWLAAICGAGSNEPAYLLRVFEDARAVYEADKEALMQVPDCSQTILKKLQNKDLSHAEAVLEQCFMEGIRVIPCDSPMYPERLHGLFNKPLVLYARGDIENLNSRFCAGVVGTRNMTQYGKMAAFRIVRELCGYGAIIVSGAAYGIDSVANNTALFFDTPTIAVLGSGVNVPYPHDHAPMLDQIAQNGMVISEFEPNTAPYGRNFPIRNRIISGLSDALLVVEADETSGALITARKAADQNRMVYAVPGNIDQKASAGTNRLLRDGARVCCGAKDIVEDFADLYKLEPLDSVIKSEKYIHYEMNYRMRERLGKTVAPNGQPANPIVRPISFERKKENRAPKDEVVKKEAPVPEMPAESNPVLEQKKRERINMLDELQRRVLDAMPSTEAISPDLIARTGIPAGEVLSSLTILEMYSLAEALPGGLYRKLV